MTYLIHNLNPTSQPFIFTQILLMPSVQLHNHCSHPALLPSRSEHYPGSGYFFVGNTPAADAGDRNIIDELARMFEETVLNLDRGYLGTGNFESVLSVKSISMILYAITLNKKTHLRSISEPKRTETGSCMNKPFMCRTIRNTIQTKNFHQHPHKIYRLYASIHLQTPPYWLSRCSNTPRQRCHHAATVRQAH